MPATQTTHTIRPYRPTDRDAIRRICADTAWMGEPRPEMIVDDWLWAEFWTRYFTDREPQHLWVVVRKSDGAVRGYLTGAVDHRDVNRYALRLLPGLLGRALVAGLPLRADAWRGVRQLLRGLWRGEMNQPPELKTRYPAVLHFDLLPDVRRMGFGGKLVDIWCARLRELGVPGVHAQSLSLNEAAAGLFKKKGFELLHEQPTVSLDHLEKRPIAVHTWVKSLA